MPFNVNEFRSHFSKYNDFAKVDKFDVHISIPLSVSDEFGTKELSLQCDSAELPGRNINMIEHRHYAFTERVPHYSFFGGECNLSFLCNAEMAEKKVFDAWLDSMIPVSNGLVRYNDISNYTSTVVIKQYSPFVDAEQAADQEKRKDGRIKEAIKIAKGAAKDKVKSIADPIFGSSGPKAIPKKTKFDDNYKPRVVYECTLVDALPIIVAPISLNWGDDAVMRMTVTFVYTKWFSKDIPVVQNALDPTTANRNNVSKRLDQRILDQIKVDAKNKVGKTVNDKLGKVIRIPRFPRI